MKCPKCGSENYTPIMYGYPSQEAIEAEVRGELILGGCVVPSNASNVECDKCKHRFMVKLSEMKKGKSK